MKINPVSNPNILNNYLTTKTYSDTTRAPSGRDEVTFSKEALEFSKALADARDALEFRTPEEQSRIADISNAIRNGEYSVSSDKIADKILESVMNRR